MDRQKIEDLVKKFLAGEASATEEKFLLEKAQSDQKIRDILKLNQHLSHSEVFGDVPDEDAFKKMRQGTINTLYRQKDKKIMVKLLAVFDYIVLPFRIPQFSFSIAVVMLILGFAISDFGRKDDLLSSITLSAQNSKNLQSSIDAPFFYSNAQFKELDDGLINVTVDVAQHINVNSQKNDPLVQDILAQSLVNSKNMPTRLKYISKTKDIVHPKIKEALINTMLNDEHPIVRQKSMSSLLLYTNDTSIQEALLQVLANEQSVYMRLAALEYLSNYDVNKELLDRAFNKLNWLNNSTVPQKIKKLNYNK